MYVNIPDDYMDVLMRSEGVSFVEKRRKQDDMSSCCHSCVEEGIHVYKLEGGQWWETTVFCVRLLSYMHMDTVVASHVM